MSECETAGRLHSSLAMKKRLVVFAAVALLLAGGLFAIRKRLLHQHPASQESTLKAHLGQIFIVGIPGPVLDPATEQQLRYIQPGGIVLYFRNFSSTAQLQSLITQLQSLARETTGRPYLIMLDEEPGGATRLGLFRNVFAFGEPNWNQIDHDIGTLERLGINVELAPLADFPFNHESFIRRRIPAHNVEALEVFNTRFIALLQRHGISATLKHFPGMGAFIDDPHKKLPRAEVEAGMMKASVKIFQQGIASGADLVMTGHAVYDNLDPEHPATLSRKIVTGLLRQKLNFQGPIITDDLSDMPFITGQDISLDEATVQAMEAGHTMVLFSHKLAKTLRIFDQVLIRAEQDPALTEIVEADCQRVFAFKEAHFSRTGTPGARPSGPGF
jgi:beta-N-acetylhexosaminidase